MLDFWVDLETAAGVKVGSGPITSATQWQHTPRLDGAGEFSFTMPASDTKSINVTQRRIARCRAVLNGAITELGAGIVERVERNVSDPTMLTVSGRDLMGELADVSVEHLYVREQQWAYLNVAAKGTTGLVKVPRSGPAALDTSANTRDANAATDDAVNIARDTDPTGFPEANNWWYTGYDSRFDQVRFTLKSGGRVNERDSAFRLQYYADSGSWVDLAIDSDGTATAGHSLAKDGIVAFTRPTDWVRYDDALVSAGNWFWVRFGVTVASGNEAIGDLATGGYVDLAEVEVYADFPTTNGVNLVMAYAPSTWTQSGYAATVASKYLEYQGESVLEALLMLAEQGGQDGGAAVREHFRYDTATARKIDWMGTTVTASGVRAMDVSDPTSTAAEIVQIVSLSETEDTSETVTRIFPFSGDNIGIATADRTAPTGYAEGTSTDGNAYLQHTAGLAAYGAIERWAQFSEITSQQTQTITTHKVYTAGAVYDKAIEYLRQHATSNKFYTLQVARFLALLKAGDTIECVYHEWVDGVHTVNIDTVAAGAPLYILAPTLQIDSQGIGVIGLDLSTIDRKAKSDADVVVDLVRGQRNYSAGATSIAGGVQGTGSTPPSAGPDIRVTGYQVSRAGNGVLLFDSGGAVLREYATIVAACAVASAGDVIQLSAGTYVEDFTIPTSVAVVGMGNNVGNAGLVGVSPGTRIQGTVTMGAGSALKHVSVEKNENNVAAVTAIIIPALGAVAHMWLDNVLAYCVNITGPGYALSMAASSTVWAKDTDLLGSGGTVGYAGYITAGALYHLSGRAAGTTLRQPYYVSGPGSVTVGDVLYE